jgi:glutamine amidotransferase PdxT
VPFNEDIAPSENNNNATMNQQSMTPRHTPLTIGVLALQGAFEAHAKALTALGATAKLVRTPAELANLDGLIIPGGESTTFLKFLERGGFLAESYLSSSTSIPLSPH